MSENWDEKSTIIEATAFFQNTVEVVEDDLAVELRRYVPNALMNVAISRLLQTVGREKTSDILDSLSYAIASGADPDFAASAKIAGVENDQQPLATSEIRKVPRK
ncbi:MAG: hypothetical protein CMM52_15540 [Rhodospirillaceae bacterium]|nr:hypothetical protein [Rhodospirillaceae bacterium]|tara:strand:+ start:6296 stop:6610 length:315 start_codon:yes stop_codon:yes gene_type:complete